MTTLRSSRVNLQQIEISDTTFSLTPAAIQQPPPALLDSVRRCGILHPPILKERATGSYQVVAGRLRLLAGRETAPALSVNCLVLPDEVTEIAALAVSLEETMLRGRISLIEQAVFFQKALAWVPEEEAARDFLPLLGHKPQPRVIRELLRFLDLEEPLQLAVHGGFLHEGVARDLLHCTFPERLALFELIETLHLSVGGQKKLLAACRDLALRHRTSVISILSEPRLAAIIRHPESNPPQKAANVLRLLEEMCHPLLAEAEQEYRSFVGRLALPPGVSLEHTPAFEKDTLSLAVPFKNREEFLRLWPGIRQALT